MGIIRRNYIPKKPKFFEVNTDYQRKLETDDFSNVFPSIFPKNHKIHKMTLMTASDFSGTGRGWEVDIDDDSINISMVSVAVINSSFPVGSVTGIFCYLNMKDTANNLLLPMVMVRQPTPALNRDFYVCELNHPVTEVKDVVIWLEYTQPPIRVDTIVCELK